MPALERWDDWEAAVDDGTGQATSDGAGHGHAAGPVQDRDDRTSRDPLAAAYDDHTLAAIDGRAAPSAAPATARGWASRVAGGAVVVGLVTGVRDALDLDDESDPVAAGHDVSPARLEAVTVHLVWGDPAAGVAVVRPWLL